ncbi:RidA family protein [Shinella sp.]|uniref:RidA family protein n=1 Tax=Shinella sp. TaxID=1870904 RepID=UPI0028B129C1|nr:RidA family protein [Shinella sp.]
MSAIDRLKALGLEFPADFSPGGNYIPFRRCGDVLYFSGQGPRMASGDWITGTVGEDVTVEQAYEQARGVGLALLATAGNAAGSLDRIEVVKIFGMVRARSDFARHADVINGCSDVLVNVLGERGKHARSAVGMGSLPNGMTVEIEGIMRILPEDENGLV